MMDFNKPRVAIYYFVTPQTNYRNDGAPLFVNYNLRKILNGKPDMGNETGNVIHFFPMGNVNKYGKFDLHLLVDHGEDALAVPLDYEYPHPNAYWVSDAHLGFEHRLNTAKKFDRVFVAQKVFIDQFVKGGIEREKIHYLPHAFEPDVYHPYNIISKWKWCFIGHPNSPHRIQFLDRFGKEWPFGEDGYLGWRDGFNKGFNELDDIAKKLSQSLVGLNYSIKEDLNMRVFETLGTRTCLLTDQVPDIQDHFEDMNHLVLFKTIEEAVDKMKMLLRDDNTRMTIAENGYREALQKHTYAHRVQEILKTCVNYENKGELVCL